MRGNPRRYLVGEVYKVRNRLPGGSGRAMGAQVVDRFGRSG